ncbi:MAG: hypothetical protein LW884_10355 [Bacteroidetes bacterium]|jgi:type III secretory pathway component EscU|nr:hypothetical protein [Bacteroidota bacterium]
MKIKWKGAAERYLIVVWFARFERFGSTGFQAVAFLTLFVSMLTAAPFVYYVQQGRYTLLDNALTWVLFLLGYFLAIFVVQNLIWLLIRAVLYLLEEL